MRGTRTPTTLHNIRHARSAIPTRCDMTPPAAADSARPAGVAVDGLNSKDELQYFYVCGTKDSDPQ